MYLNTLNRLFHNNSHLTLWDNLFDFSHEFSEDPFIFEPQRAYLPAINIYEADNQLIFMLEAPGMKKEDFKIEIEDGVLKVSGKREQNQIQEYKALLQERSNLSFSRYYKLPSNIKTESSSAQYKDGILEIKFQKTEESKPKLIEIA